MRFMSWRMPLLSFATFGVIIIAPPGPAVQNRSKEKTSCQELWTEWVTESKYRVGITRVTRSNPQRPVPVCASILNADQITKHCRPPSWEDCWREHFKFFTHLIVMHLTRRTHQTIPSPATQANMGCIQTWQTAYLGGLSRGLVWSRRKLGRLLINPHRKKQLSPTIPLFSTIHHVRRLLHLEFQLRVYIQLRSEMLST